MNQDFNSEEIKSVVKMARVYNPGFSEDMFESLMELGNHISDSGYLDVVQGIPQIEEENEVKFTDAIAICRQLMEQKEKLERQIPELEKRKDSIKERINQSSNEYKQIKNNISNAGQELEQSNSERVEAEKKLDSFQKKLEKEIQRVKAEIERYRQESKVTKEEISAAGILKKEAKRHGFDIDFMLEVAKEFAGYEDSNKVLSEGLKKHTSLTKYLDELSDNAGKEKSRINKEISTLESSKKNLENERIRLTNITSHLQEDIKGEEELRRFYYRYVTVSPLIEQLAS